MIARWLRAHGQATVAYGVGLVAILAVPPLLNVIPGVAPGYVLYLVSLALIYAIVAIGLGLLTGHTGQISLGHAGFFAIGAYASALATFRLGLPFVIALLIAGSLSAAAGFLLGLPALRLSGPYLAVATLGFGLAVPQLVVWQEAWTGGSSGLHGLPLASIPLGVLTIVFRTDQDYYYLAVAVLVLLTIFARNVVRSHTGRAFAAIRDSEIAARAMGVDLVRYKTTAFALSALYAGIAGGLYAHLLHGISPEDFTLLLSIDFLTMIVLGGLGSVGGALAGALLLTFLQNVLTRLPVVSEFKNLYIVVLGLTLILTISFFPQGMAGIVRGWRMRWATATLERASRPGPIVELDERGTR